MRIWSLHPKYLDAQGLVALWRETLLARAVLRGKTKGYRNHPQLSRFKACASPVSAVNAYLVEVVREADARGYSFDRSKVGPVRGRPRLPCAKKQLAYEWKHLRLKLSKRSPDVGRKWRAVRAPELHPLFRLGPGPVADWERPRG